jgi:hypothetical protein
MNLDHELEAALGRVMTPTDAPDDAAQRVLARLAATPLPPQRRAWLSWWPSALTDVTFAPAWPRVATLACAAVLGVSIGLSSFGTRIATGLDLMRQASADETAVNIFDTDLLTGARQ